MQLDQTHLVIRERSQGDLLDLAVVFCRAHLAPLSLALVAGAGPMVALNLWLLGSVLDDVEFQPDVLYGYFYLLTVLVLIETPLATSFVTLYLGQAAFQRRPKLRRILADWFISLPQLLLYQVFIRAILAWFVALLLPIWVLGAVHPFLNEVILLERNPWRRRKPRGGRPGAVATPSSLSRSILPPRERAAALGRWIMFGFLGVLLTAVIWVSIIYLRWMLFFVSTTQRETYGLYLQLAIWPSVGFFAVARFLNYLDVRIREEGWELELAMRAEGSRLARSVA